MASATGRGELTDQSLYRINLLEWSIRGNDPIVKDPRRFSDHPLREHGDAVIAGFTELRSIAVGMTNLYSLPLVHSNGDALRPRR
jgi:hypothetical protein